MTEAVKIFLLLSFITIGVQCESLKGTTIKVSTVVGSPYVMLKNYTEGSELTGNDRFEGYIVDLIDEISKILEFNYVLNVNELNMYGNRDNTGKWHGMIGDLLDGQADLAASGMTITAERESVVDFLMPFMATGISILYKKDTPESRGFSSLDELLKQDSVRFGCLRGGSTENFLSESKDPVYSKIWSRMSSTDPSPLATTNIEGVNRVLSGNYAYFMESTTLEYITARDCELYQVGGLLDSKGYGLAVRQGSPLREPLNGAILKLQESGRLAELKNKWWNELNGGDAC